MLNKAHRILFLFTVISFVAYSHEQPVHQHITREGFKLLCKTFPQLSNSDMAAYIGTSEVWSGGSADGSFGALRVVSGSWLEDEYDVVYGYGLTRSPSYNQPLPVDFLIQAFGSPRAAHTSITHFWVADNGEYATTSLGDWANYLGVPTYWSFTISENAMQKMHKYANGVYDFVWGYNNEAVDWSWCGLQRLQALTKFHGIGVVDMYKDLAAFQAFSYLDAEDGRWYATDCPGWDQTYVDFHRAHAYEILGRMCHLLQDQSVPAHVHSNAHACTHGMYCDYYEGNAPNYHLWTADEVYNGGRRFIYPFNTWGDPLYYLMYLMNEVTDHYASGKTNGNDNYDLFCPDLEATFTTLGSPTTTDQVNDSNCRAMHDKLFPLAIRATAGLLYWFAVETGLLNVIRVPEDYETIAQALSVAASGQTILVSGSQTVSSYLTVNSGVTLQMNPGSSLVFSSSSTRVVVSGNLILNGTSDSHITIDGQGYSRSAVHYATIVVAGSGTATVQYTDFVNAPYEMTMWYTSGAVTVQNGSFSNFGYTSDAKALTTYSTTGSIQIANNTFTGSNHQGTAVYSYNSGTNVTISGNDICNTGTGVRCYISNAFLTNNYVHNNWNYGIQADNLSGYLAEYRGNVLESSGCNLWLNASSPWVMQSTILGGSANTVTNTSLPNFGRPPGDGDNLHGHNTIRYGGLCLVKAQNYSLPYMGYVAQGGYNSLYDIDLLQLKAETNSGIYADNNYWGVEGIQNMADGTSWILARYPLETNPNGGGAAKLAFQTSSGNQTVIPFLKTSADSLESAFLEALDLAKKGQLAEAKAVLRMLLDANSTKYSPLALLLFYDLERKELQRAGLSDKVSGEFADLLNSLRSAARDNLLRPFAVRIQAREAGIVRDFAAVKKYRQDLVNEYPNSPHEVAALYDLTTQYVEIEENLAEARKLLERMKEVYPDDELTTAARVLLGEKVTWGTGEHKSELQRVHGETEEFRVHEPFPNPFNPVTTLRYDLPSPCDVSLVVYDVMGREVAVLAHGLQEAGSHSATWHAPTLASGVYFARFTVKNESGAMIFNQVNKLLLMK